MRILLTQHFPLRSTDSGRWTRGLARALAAAGHLVRVLVMDTRGKGTSDIEVRHVVFSPGDPQADLDFELPNFSVKATSAATFESLSEAQLAAYREAFRQRLDEEVDQFNPQLVHAQHVWIQGQLVLESGVPYVLSAWGPELSEAGHAARHRQLAEQAADNASRIFTFSEKLAQQLRQTFDDVAPRLVRILPAIAITAPPASLGTSSAVLSALKLPASDGPLVVCPAQSSLEDGLEALINAAGRYETSPSKPVTVIVAEGTRGSLESHARRLGLQRLHVVGALDEAERAALLTVAAIVVLPTMRPGREVTAVEALAYGTPVLATAESDLAEIVTPQVGGIIAGGDHEVLADHVERALAEDWKQTRGPQARLLAAERFTFDQVLPTIVGVYQAVLVERFGQLPE